MHLFGRTCNRIDGASLYAKRATDADVLINEGKPFGFGRIGLCPKGFIDCAGNNVGQKIRQFVDAFIATGRAAIDVRFTRCNRRCIRLAAGEAALPALRLGQDGIDLFDERIAFNVKFYGSKTQYRTEYDGEFCHD